MIEVYAWINYMRKGANGMNILFVCTGNTCRSPMAEAIFRHYAKESYEVQSAGLFAESGSDASAHAKHALENKGIAVNHSSQQVTEELLDWADLIVTMTGSHRDNILIFYPHLSEKIITLYEAAGESKRDITDPYGGSLSVYKQTLDELEILIQRFIEKLEHEHS